MSSSIGRTLRVVGIVLIVILAIELLILSPKLFGRSAYPIRDVAERPPTSSAAAVNSTERATQAPTPLVLATPTLVIAEETKAPDPTVAQEQADSTATPNPTATQAVTAEPEALATEFPAVEETEPVEIPAAYSINSIVHKKQAAYWSYAGPDNLAILMSYWGIKTTQYDVATVLHGSAERTDDRNVSPAELASYVQDNSELNVIVRYGGSLDLLRELVAAGFPVLIQNSFPVSGDKGWLGHYTIINGYNQSRDTFLTTDSYVGPFQNYDTKHIEDSWRAFNNLFIVLFPDTRADQALSVLREWTDEEWATQRSLAFAGFEVEELEGRDRFFAQFNAGTALVALGEYADAAEAYDLAYGLYAGLSDFDRPTRMLWYQTGPYEAYYQRDRYQQVIDLADATLASLPFPILEETFYWRGRAAEALNYPGQAEFDMDAAHTLNPNLFPIEE